MEEKIREEIDELATNMGKALYAHYAEHNRFAEEAAEKRAESIAIALAATRKFLTCFAVSIAEVNSTEEMEEFVNEVFAPGLLEEMKAFRCASAASTALQSTAQ